MKIQFSPNLNNVLFSSGRRKYMNKINLNNGEVEKLIDYMDMNKLKNHLNILKFLHQVNSLD